MYISPSAGTMCIVMCVIIMCIIIRMIIIIMISSSSSSNINTIISNITITTCYEHYYHY